MVYRRVDRTQVNRFVSETANQLKTCQTRLSSVATAVATVRWHGGNAATYKATSATLVDEFVRNVDSQIQVFCGSIYASTARLYKILGTEPPPAVNIEPMVIAAPDAIATDDVPAIDSAGLENLIATIESETTSISQSFENIGLAFAGLSDADSWAGPEYESAKADVDSRLTSLKAEVATSGGRLTKYLRDQLSDL